MPTNQKYTLSVSERLKSYSSIAKVFASGKSLFSHPIKLKYLVQKKSSGESQLLFSVSVPKRIHKKAVTRNLLKRRVREAYRKNKPDIHETLSCHLMFILIDSNVTEYAKIEKAVKKINQELSKLLSSTHV